MSLGALVGKEVEQLYREYSGRLITSLLTYFEFAHLQLAEDIVQEAFVSAFKDWSKKGMPDDPAAWLYKVCKNKALNEQGRRRVQQQWLKIATDTGSGINDLENIFLQEEIKHSQLRLLFATCHPSLSAKSQVILTLKVLYGLRVEEIAKGLGMNPEAVKKNVSRSKQQIRSNNILLRVPFRLESKERLGAVHQVLYLIFNEGYYASFGKDMIRREVCLQALQLVRALIEEDKISSHDTHALFALMLFNIARFDARENKSREPIELERQDRSLWDKDLIQQGIRHFNISKNALKWSRYHFEAGIASLHCTAPCFASTNWLAILKLYDLLLQLQDSPFVRMNRSIALYYSGKAKQALESLEQIKGMEENPLYLITLGEINSALGNRKKALECFMAALARTTHEAEKKTINKKITRFGDL